MGTELRFVDDCACNYETSLMHTHTLHTLTGLVLVTVAPEPGRTSRWKAASTVQSNHNHMISFVYVVFCRMYTLFAKSLPLDVASRVWDVFCRDGEEFLFRTALGLATAVTYVTLYHIPVS